MSFRKVAGIPLLERVIATACRNGGTEVLLLHPKTLPATWLKAHLNSSLLSPIPVHLLALERAFNPDEPSDWQTVESRLDEKFLWLPWNYLADKKALILLFEAAETTGKGVRLDWRVGLSPAETQEGDASPTANTEMPAVIVKEKLTKIAEDSRARSTGIGSTLSRYLANGSLQVVSPTRSPGVIVDSLETAQQAERELVRRSGKDSHGIYSKANRWLVRPAVRWLSKTPITPNIVTFAGLAVNFLSGYWFSKGHWSAYVVGALLYFAGVLFDEIDGMLARTTFRESAFGTWLETFVDYAGYILLFIGMTIGLYRENGARWLVAGGLLLFGTLASFLVLIRQRKLATDPSRPHEYRQRLHRRLEADSGNILSRFGRLTEFLVRNGAFCYYVLISSSIQSPELSFSLRPSFCSWSAPNRSRRRAPPFSCWWESPSQRARSCSPRSPAESRVPRSTPSLRCTWSLICS